MSTFGRSAVVAAVASVGLIIVLAGFYALGGFGPREPDGYYGVEEYRPAYPSPAPMFPG